MLKKNFVLTTLFPYLFSSMLFILLTYPGTKFINIHMKAGYLSYVFIGVFSVLIIHISSVYFFKKFLVKKADRESVSIIIDRFNLLWGMGIVLFFDGLCGDCFHYRKWAYGVNRVERVIEKIEDNWNQEKLNNSKQQANYLGKNIIEYTNNLNLRWEKYHNK